MNFEHLRSLLYPLGFLASVFFSLRFMIQWIQSERQKKSIVSKTFWRLSLTGNLLMVFHSLIQLQYPIAALQSLNGVIAFRNLNLMGPAPFSFRKTLSLLLGAVGFVTLLFFLPFFFTDEPLVFMRHPVLPWNKLQATETSFLWQLTGFIGLALFGSRFCVQWWLAEKHKTSFLGHSFWWMSLFGAGISLFYFIRIGDPVNILGYGLGLIPYARNLKLLLQKKIASMKKEEIFFVAGEMSGDVLGANLLKELNTHLPSVAHYGVGGPQMRAQGLRCLFPTEHLQVMGFSDVFKALPRLFSQFKKIQKYVLNENPKAVVFIDYPDFNMRLAKKLRKKGYAGKLIHYVCPSVWAWRASRIQDLEKRLDLLLTILPFEKECFVNSSLAVTFVGHPLVAAKDAHPYDMRWRDEISFPSEKKILSLFPGSRSHEIALNLPKLLETAALFSQEMKDISIAVSIAHPDLENPIREIVRKCALPVTLVPFRYRYELMKESFAALATSGTVTLELALHQIPTVVVYKISPFNYFLGRYLLRIRLPHFTLVNLIAQKRVFPEFFHRDFSAKDIATALKTLIENRETCCQECHRVRSLLTEENASKKAAGAISLLLQDSF